jgi:hypothetical protein
MKNAILALLILAALPSCTENTRARVWGGTATVEIPRDQKFVNATWKDVQLWILTRKRTSVDTLREEYHFHEKSSYGLIEGQVIIKEL